MIIEYLKKIHLHLTSKNLPIFGVHLSNLKDFTQTRVEKMSRMPGDKVRAYFPFLWSGLSFYFLLIYALESALALRSDTLKSSRKIPRWSCWIIKKRWSLRYGPRKPEQHSLLQKWNQRDSIRIRYLESHRKRHFWKSLFSRKEGFEINLCYESSSQGRSDRLRPSGKHKAREGNLTKSNQF